MRMEYVKKYILHFWIFKYKKLPSYNYKVLKKIKFSLKHLFHISYYFNDICLESNINVKFELVYPLNLKIYMSFRFLCLIKYFKKRIKSISNNCDTSSVRTMRSISNTVRRGRSGVYDLLSWCHLLTYQKMIRSKDM